MSQIERREIIRDDYDYKIYEIIYIGEKTFVHDHALQGVLMGEERIEVLKSVEGLRIKSTKS